MPEAARHRLLPRHHARADDRGAQFAAPRAWGPRGCGACPGYRGPITALQPVPGAPAPGPALDLTLALPVAGGWAPLPQRRFQTLPHSQHPRARGAAPGHDPPAGPPQNRAGAGSSGLEGPPLATGIATHRDCHESAPPRRWDCHALALSHRPPALVLGSPQRTPAPPHAITSSRAFFPTDPQPLGAQGPPNPRAGQPLRWRHLPCPPPARTNRSVFWEDAFLRALGLVLTPGSD